MFAGFQRREGNGGVEIVGERDRKDVDVGACEELFPVGDELGDAEFVGGLASALGRDLGEGHDLGGGVLFEGGDVIEADGTGADYGDVKGVFFLGHGEGQESSG